MDSEVTNVFFDFEFTGLHQNTTPVSIGMIVESPSDAPLGDWIYREFLDYDETQVDEWIEAHVISNLWGDPAIAGTRGSIAAELRDWLAQFDRVHMWGDCLSYDWMLFCELFGGAMHIPKNVHYIPFDLCTLLLAAGIDPDIDREHFAGILPSDEKHNALWDADTIRACYARASHMIRAAHGQHRDNVLEARRAIRRNRNMRF